MTRIENPITPCKSVQSVVRQSAASVVGKSVVAMKQHLLSNIHHHTAPIAIIGLGYVGLPLAVALAETGFPVVGIDVDGRKVADINRGASYVGDIPSERLAPVVRSGKLRATADFAALDACDADIICVPVLLNKTCDPDVRYLISSGEEVAGHIHRLAARHRVKMILNGYQSL